MIHGDVYYSKECKVLKEFENKYKCQKPQKPTMHSKKSKNGIEAFNSMVKTTVYEVLKQKKNKKFTSVQ